MALLCRRKMLISPWTRSLLLLYCFDRSRSFSLAMQISFLQQVWLVQHLLLILFIQQLICCAQLQSNMDDPKQSDGTNSIVVQSFQKDRAFMQHIAVHATVLQSINGHATSIIYALSRSHMHIKT